ncbi:BTAD domain-containing putative transcriptional regulator [Nocardia sp. NPDC059195]|uniref:BTAD domain-containing putative transcriptional regulator n=1 Tax=Nocardia sp. NPDC059195 TaxID=3346765 RepID=UPI00367BBB7E
MTTGSQAPLLIAVAGLSPRAGTTTTTVALAHAWPGPETALIVEADPLGGQLAEIVGADPYLGLASLARMTHPGEPITPDILARHVQRLPGGEALLAAPPHRDHTRALPAAELLTDPHGSWRAFGATLFADCGVPELDSPAHPVIAAADACLFVVRAEHIDPEPAAQRILDLTRRRRPRGIVLIGASRAYAAAIGFPVLGTLPASRAASQALLKGRRARRHLISPARLIISDVEIQLRANGRDRLAQPYTPRAARQNRPSRRDDGGPRIYSIDGGPVSASRPRPPEPVLVEPAEPSTPPTASEPVLIEVAEDAGQPSEDDLAAAPEASLGLETEIADSAPLSMPTPAEPALRLRVFGPTRIFWRKPETGESVEITSQLQPRIRELLTVLALHPEGLPREQLIERLWSQRPSQRGGSALANTLSRLRAAITAATGGQITSVLAEDRLQLSDLLLGVDYWDFTSAVAARRRASNDAEQADAARHIAALATSELASDLTDTWVEALRESARRTSLNALSWLAIRNTENDPRATLGILETTVENDPFNESVWQDILRLHARLGEKAALTRTYTLLTHTLAEIGQTPSLETRQLLERLRHTPK